MWKLIGESYSWSAAIRFQTKLSKLAYLQANCRNGVSRRTGKVIAQILSAGERSLCAYGVSTTAELHLLIEAGIPAWRKVIEERHVKVE